METLHAIDNRLIVWFDKAFNTLGKSMGLSYPTMMWLFISATIILMSVGTLISWSNPLPLRVILLALYACLAFWMGRTTFRHLSYFQRYWSPQALDKLSSIAVSNRNNQRVIRAGIALVAAVFISLSAGEAFASFQLGNMPAIGVARNIVSNMFGIPVLLMYYYAMCVVPDPGIAPDPGVNS